MLNSIKILTNSINKAQNELATILEGFFPISPDNPFISENFIELILNYFEFYTSPELANDFYSELLTVLMPSFKKYHISTLNFSKVDHEKKLIIIYYDNLPSIYINPITKEAHGIIQEDLTTVAIQLKSDNELKKSKEIELENLTELLENPYKNTSSILEIIKIGLNKNKYKESINNKILSLQNDIQNLQTKIIYSKTLFQNLFNNYSELQSNQTSILAMLNSLLNYSVSSDYNELPLSF